MLKREKYKIRDGVSRFNSTDMNPIFWDIDGRLHTLEELRINWEAAVADIQQHGLERINSVIAPVLDEAGASLGEIQAELTSLQVQVAAFDDWWDSRYAVITDLQTRVDALETNKVPSLGHLSGLGHSKKDADSLTVYEGALEINGGDYSLLTATDVQLTGLSSSAWHYLYVTPPASGAALAEAQFSASTTAPVRDHAKGGAWYNTSGNARCIGFFLTDGSGDIIAANCTGGWWWLADGMIQILSTASPATGWTLLSIGGPALGRMRVMGQGYSFTGSSVADLRVTNGDGGTSTTNTHQWAGAPYSYSGSGETTRESEQWVRMTNTAGQIKYFAGSGATANLFLHGIAIPSGMAG